MCFFNKLLYTSKFCKMLFLSCNYSSGFTKCIKRTIIKICDHALMSPFLCSQDLLCECSFSAHLPSKLNSHCKYAVKPSLRTSFTDSGRPGHFLPSSSRSVFCIPLLPHFHSCINSTTSLPSPNMCQALF